MSRYTHFSIEEREKSMVMKEQGKSLRTIARELNRSPSTICREMKRNSERNGVYSASSAEKKYRQRRKKCCRTPMLAESGDLKAYVTERLTLGWTPDEISGRAKLDNEPFSVSYNTIYRAIENGVIPKRFRLCLRFKRIKNRKRKNNDKRGKIPDPVSIRERPEEAESRAEFGHWESDTVQGKRGTGCFGTHVERKSGFLIAFRLSKKTDRLFNEATEKAFAHLPSCVKKSFTVDNGKEFWLHKELAAATRMAVYFCDPYSPWQRGTNENTNGLLRYYFPKKSSFSDISDQRLAHVVDLINNRPRKRLGYKTPFEVFSKCCT